MRYGIGIARKGWLRSSDVLNTMPIEALLDFFKERRGLIDRAPERRNK
jgi:hypothetical protein